MSPSHFSLAPNRKTLRLLLASCLLGISVVAQSADPKASKFFEDALARYEKKDIPGAIIQLKNAIQADPNLLPVHALLGKALIQNGEVAAAEVAIVEAMRLGVARAELIVPLAQALIEQGKQQQIFDDPRFNPAGLPGQVQAQLLVMRAGAYADLGDMRNAMKAVEEAKAVDPRSASPLLAEVAIRIRNRQFKEAGEAADRAIVLAPDLADAVYKKGSVQHVAGDLPAALAAYDRALKLDAGHNDARIARVGLLMDLGRASDAKADIAELKTRAPGDPRATYLQALIAERENDPAQAQAALREVTELLDPVPMSFIRYRPQILMLNGLAHFGLNQREKAKLYLEGVYRAQSGSSASKVLARIYLDQRDNSKAIDVLENYLKAQPRDGQALTMLASAHMASGRHAKAVALATEALQTRDSPVFRTALGMSLIGSGKLEAGLAELEATLKRDPRQIAAATALVNSYLRNGQSTKAVAVVDNLIKQQPANAGYHNLLGIAQGQTGNIPKARAAFEQAIKLDDSLLLAKVNLARLEIAARSYDSATARLNAVLKADGRNPDAMYEMAVIVDRQGKTADAVRWLTRANDFGRPGELRWGLALVEFHLGKGNALDAMEAARNLLAKAPDDLLVLLAFARAQLATGDKPGAKSTLAGASRFADYSAAPQSEIATLQLRAGDVGGAAYSLGKALSVKPDNLEANILMAQVELLQNEPQKSAQRARSIITSHPKRAVGYRLLGDMTLVSGKPADAIQHYRRAHQVEPSTDSMLRLIRVLATQDGGKPALQEGEQWLKTNPKDLQVRRALADGYAQTSQFPQARRSYEAIRVTTPNDAAVMNNLANVLQQLKDPSAVKMAEQAVANSTGNAKYLDTLGWIQFQNGQEDRALQNLRDARLREPSNPDIRYHLAAVLVKAGRKGEARAEIDAALASGVGFESAAAARTLLQQINQ
jgi:putative PEP-CTERM system TPR-repeat lipoprotein